MSWRRVWREITVWGLLLLFLAGFGAVVWATHYPDHPILARAAGWPAVGPLVERFRTYYGVGQEAAEGAGGEEAEGGDEASGFPPLGELEGDSDFAGGGEDGVGEATEDAAGEPRVEGGGAPLRGDRSRSAPDAVWVVAGEEVRESPSASAPVLSRHPVFEQLAVLERSGDWARVATTAGEGWVRVDPGDDASYPLGQGLRPTVPLPGARPDSRELRAAREMLGADAAAGEVGPYPLYTDVRPVSSLYRLDRLAQQVEAVYRQRYGRPLEGEPAEAVLVFTDEARYRLYQTREARLQGLPSGGHSGRGLVVLWVGDRAPHDVAATFLHELGHVLNRRAVGPALPPWLDEGMAEDLSLSEVTESGELRLGRLGGATVRRELGRGQGRIEYQGAVAALRNLNASFARTDALGLEELTSMDWEHFVRSDRRILHYAHAGFFVRYLVETPELTPGFRRFLDRVAAGGPATGEALRRELDRSWQQLDDGLAEWVRGKILDTTLEARGGEARAG